MFDETIKRDAHRLLAELRADALQLATAESCTGGLLSALFTEFPGSSDIFDRGFVVYSNDAKHEMLDVPLPLIEQYGAVSREVAMAMAEGAIANSDATIAISVTGIAGPGGGSPDKPVGMVHIAVAQMGGPQLHQEHLFGDIGRGAVRTETLRAAVTLLRKAHDANRGMRA